MPLFRKTAKTGLTYTVYVPAAVAVGSDVPYEPEPSLYCIVPFVLEPALINVWAEPVYVNDLAVGAVTLSFSCYCSLVFLFRWVLFSRWVWHYNS